MEEVLNKKELADRLAEKFDHTKKAANEEVQFILDEITNELSKGNTVDLSGFGKFTVKFKPAHTGINPSTKEKILIEDSKTVSFKASKALRNSVQ